MNKRQRKKNEKKYLPIIADEANLLTMTPEELEKAFADYEKFREKYAFRKKYKDLKKGEILRYNFPTGEKMTDFIKYISNVSRKTRSSTEVVVQSIDDWRK